MREVAAVVLEVAAVGDGVLRDQVDLLGAARDELLDLGHDVFDRARALLAAHATG